MSELGYGFTEINEMNAKSILDIEKTKEIIKQGFPIRTTAEEIRKLIENVSDASNVPPDILEKNVKTAVGSTSYKNWTDGKNTISRQSAIKISFALKLDSALAARFIVHGCWHDGFYIRDEFTGIGWLSLGVFLSLMGIRTFSQASPFRNP